MKFLGCYPLKVLFIDNYLKNDQFEELCDPFQMQLCQKSCSGENLCKKVASEQLFWRNYAYFVSIED